MSYCRFAEDYDVMNDANRLLERSCVVCGADLQIVLDGDNNILSGGYYFTTRLDEGESEWEYWECKKCYEDSPENSREQ